MESENASLLYTTIVAVRQTSHNLEHHVINLAAIKSNIIDDHVTVSMDLIVVWRKRSDKSGLSLAQISR